MEEKVFTIQCKMKKGFLTECTTIQINIHIVVGTVSLMLCILLLTFEIGQKTDFLGRASQPSVHLHSPHNAVYKALLLEFEVETQSHFENSTNILGRASQPSVPFTVPIMQCTRLYFWSLKLKLKAILKIQLTFQEGLHSQVYTYTVPIVQCTMLIILEV